MPAAARTVRTWRSGDTVPPLRHLGADPSLYDSDNVVPFLSVESAPATDPMPLFETRPATGSCRMLRDKDRVPAERGLFSIFPRKGWSEAFVDEIPGVAKHTVKALVIHVGPLAHAEMEPPAKWRFLQFGKYLVDVPHAAIPVLPIFFDELSGRDPA